MDSSYMMEGGGMSHGDGSSRRSSNDSMGSWESTVDTSVDTSNETGVATKDLGLGVSGSLAIVVAICSISISSVTQSMVTQSMVTQSVVTQSMVTQSMVTQSVTIGTIVGISISLGLWGAETAGNSQGEDNQEFHVEC